MNNASLPGEDVRDPNVAVARVNRAEIVRAFIVSTEYRGRFGKDSSRGQQSGSVARARPPENWEHDILANLVWVVSLV
jgi:hypothetical protein